MNSNMKTKPAMIHPLGMAGVSVASVLVIVSSNYNNAYIQLALNLFVVAIPVIICGSLIEHWVFRFKEYESSKLFKVAGQVIAVIGDIFAAIGFFWLIKYKSDTSSSIFLGSVIFSVVALGISGYMLDKKLK